MNNNDPISQETDSYQLQRFLTQLEILPDPTLKLQPASQIFWQDNNLALSTLSTKSAIIYSKNYNQFIKFNSDLPLEKLRLCDHIIADYISDQYESTPKPGNKTNMACLLFIVYIIALDSILKHGAWQHHHNQQHL